MNFLCSTTSHYQCKYRKQIPDTVLDFLRVLVGLTVIDIKGVDQKRTRVVTTLIHGNEPSGLIACHHWLKSSNLPATNLRIIICNPEAAKEKPFFTNRYIAHSDDLNRFFSVDDNDLSHVAERARQIKQLIAQVSPEAIIDLHNTSGDSPAFGVAIHETNQHLQLIELFTTNMILTQLKVGAVMEQSFIAPIVTIECGGANEIASHQIAINGMEKLVSLHNLFTQESSTIMVRRNPIRVKLIGDASVGFSQHRLPTTDITLRADIETLNKNVTTEGEFIGWCAKDTVLPLEAIDANGEEQINHYFVNHDGCLFTRREIHFFMVTTIAEIATKDCLFYITD